MSDYLDDELDTRGQTRVRRHLARCSGCRALLESLSRTLRQLRSLGAADQVAPSPATVEAVLERLERGEPTARPS